MSLLWFGFLVGWGRGGKGLRFEMFKTFMFEPLPLFVAPVPTEPDVKECEEM